MEVATQFAAGHCSAAQALGRARCVAAALCSPCPAAQQQRQQLGRTAQVAANRRTQLRTSFSGSGAPSLRAGQGRGGVSGSGRGAAAAAARTVVANWNQEVDWSSVAVSAVEKEAESLYSLTLDIREHDQLRTGYTRAGQFVQLKVGDSKPAFLAVASPPQAAREGRMEFLVKDVEGSTAELLTRVQPGQEVAVSQVMGKGFNVDALSPPDEITSVLLFATGSGISPIRALIEAGFEAQARTDVRLYFGVRDLPYIPYQDRFKDWESAGVQVNLVLSNPSPAWEGQTGYIQDAFKKVDVLLDGPATGAVLCGHKGMAQDVAAILTAEGVPAGRILLNF